MKTLLLFLLFVTLNATQPMLRESPYALVKSSIGKGKPYFLEVGSDSCHSCQIMGKMLYKTVQEHPQYNIVFINVKKEREAAAALKIRMIPSQIIYDAQGEEIYRHIGVLAKQDLENLLNKHFKEK